MNFRKFRVLSVVLGLVLPFEVTSSALAQQQEAYYQSIATACQRALNANGRAALWSDIRASAVRDTGSTSGSNYEKRVTEHCESNLKGEKPLWNQIRDRAITSLPIPDRPFYQQRVAAHCEWLLKNTNHADWWRSIRDAAINDAGNANSDYYYQRVGGHCSSFLSQRKQPEAWSQIVLSARRDSFGR